MINYEKLDWQTLEYVKTHLYQRLALPLNQSIEMLQRLHNAPDKDVEIEKILKLQYNMLALLNTVNAWATLITYKQNGPLNAFQFKDLNETLVPAWVRAYLAQQSQLRLNITRTIEVHSDTFFEGLLLLFQVARRISQVAYVQIADAPAPRTGVFARVVFQQAEGKEPFGSLTDIINQLDQSNLAERELGMQMLVARDMLELNRAKFNLQNNKKTGHQAFTAYFEAKTEAAKEPNIYAAATVANYGKVHPGGDEDQTIALASAVTPKPLHPLVPSPKRESIAEEPTELEAPAAIEQRQAAPEAPQEGKEKEKEKKIDNKVRTHFGW